jgi:hypothetical protein
VGTAASFEARSAPFPYPTEPHWLRLIRGAAREGGCEELTGEASGRVFSREICILGDADAVRRSGRQHRVCRYCKAQSSPPRSQASRTYRNTSHGNREVPRSPWAEDAPGRIGKSEDVRR